MIRPVNIHGSCVALGGRGVLILGPSGAGKSSLALDLMAMGAGLVSDDRTLLWQGGDGIVADAPDRLRGRIEARGEGILAADPLGPVAVALVVDLGTPEDSRLPPAREYLLLDRPLPLVLGPYSFHLAPRLRQLIAKGRVH